LAYSVRQAVRAGGADKRDQATAALAISYAQLIDNATASAKYARAVRWLERLDVPEEQEHLREIIVVALAAHSVASDFGPKLLAALEALILSPRARAAAKKAVNDAKPAGSQIDQIAERRARRRTAAGVDAGVT
jgi:hypothetical protein